MTIFDSDVEHLSKYSSVILNLLPATRSLDEDCDYNDFFCIRASVHLHDESGCMRFNCKH